MCTPAHQTTVHHVSVLTGDDLIQRFWEVEEKPTSDLALTPEERTALDHFKNHHRPLETDQQQSQCDTILRSVNNQTVESVVIKSLPNELSGDV